MYNLHTLLSILFDFLQLKSWPIAYQRKVSFDIRPIQFPPGEDPQKWKKVFKMCATQRLFLPVSSDV